MNHNQLLILCGYTSSGKTTVGKLLAQKLGLPFYDTDQMLIAQNHMTIPEIFAQGGEDLFRNLERKIVNQVCTFHTAVVSTGGGMLTLEENALALSRHGLIIYLHRSFDACYQNLAQHPERPLFQTHTRDELAASYDKRSVTYQKYAAVTVDNNGLPEKAVDQILFFLNT